MQAREKYRFWVYILASRSRSLYIGFTNDLTARVNEHRHMTPGTHTECYNIHRLVYFEYFQYVRNAIAREKELKTLDARTEDRAHRKGQPYMGGPETL